MLRIDNIKLGIEDELNIAVICEKLKIKKSDILSFKILKKSLDARKKSDIHYNYSLCIDVLNEEKYLDYKNVSKISLKSFEIPKCEGFSKRPVIIGAGPAGLFAALYLSYAGCKPILIERGYEVDKRIEVVNNLWNEGVFNPISNVQFGEGGAGTFSDGKLTTGVNDDRLIYIKEKFVEFGAPEEILYLSKPHIGTDKLCMVVKNMRKELIKSGATIEFGTRFCDFSYKNGKLCDITVIKDNKIKKIECDSLILAIGHSARDTFELLNKKGIKMERKTFSIGGRIEHLQEDIGYSQYGDLYKKLPAADYKLSVKTKDNRGVYTFCMCPGGVVVCASSEEKMVVTNGMSYYDRNNINANSALLVTVNPDDIPGEDCLGGMYFQREIEKKAFSQGGENYFAPVQKVSDFLGDKKTKSLGKVVPSYLPGYKFCMINEILPQFITDAMKEAILLMDKKLKGFADSDAIITVPETRSSSPVRILRDNNFLSNVDGIYPCGEGAGYAGGIMSAALDGIKCAKALIKNNTKD